VNDLTPREWKLAKELEAWLSVPQNFKKRRTPQRFWPLGFKLCDMMPHSYRRLLAAGDRGDVLKFLREILKDKEN